MSVNKIIYFTYFILAVATFVSVWYFRRLRHEFKVIAIFIWITTIVMGFSEITAKRGVNNLFLSHIYTLLSFLILVRFYQHLLKPFFSKFLFIGLALGFVLLALINVLFWQPLHTFNSITLTVQALVFIVFSMSIFILSINEELNQHLRPFIRSLNWVNAGIFLYFTGSLLIFYNGAIIIHTIIGKWSGYTMLIHATMATIFYFCILIGLWRSPKI